MAPMMTVEQGLAKILLANPPNNTLNPDLMDTLTAELRTLAQRSARDRPYAIVLTSATEGIYSLGLDPLALLKADPVARLAVFHSLAALVEAFVFSGIPLITDVGGPAMAGGAVLAILADFTMVRRGSGKISFSETKVGLPVPRFVQELVREKVSPSAHWEVVLLGKNVEADEAVRLGLATRAYDTPAERDELIAGYLGRIARLAPDVVRATLLEGKAHLKDSLEAFRRDPSNFAPFLTDAYLGRGIKAVAEGKSPQWR